MSNLCIEVGRSVHPMLQSEAIQPSENMPSHWQLLSPANLQEYIELRANLYDQVRKSKKGERLEGFVERLKQIRRYVERSDGEDWKRSLVCGVIFLQNSLAINIQQLRITMGKCKSSINGSLQQLGYTTRTQGGQIEEQLILKVPLFQKEHSEIKKWTLREGKAITDSVSQIRQKPPLMTSPPIQAAKRTTPLPLPKIPAERPPEQRQARIIPLPSIPSSFPCPLKIKSKIYYAVHSSIAVQTD